ncbi:elongation factor EF-2 [Candidatus Woesearchaeota archaeon]|nr:MAG: elongation factor EF-2 [Candidatus Woesearchaeota archaeon]
MVDRVMAAMKHQDTIRNIAICAHIDHGKTTFSDNLLSGAGMMSEELAGQARQLDFHADEQERGITIDAASVSMVHDFEGKEYLINLIDTPGHVDFGGDVTRAMRAVDGCIVLACAVEGVMPQTETVLKQALRERVKPILFINKVDRLIKELKLTPQAMQERFTKIITHVNKLIREIGGEFGEKNQVNVQDGSVCFGSAFHNWALSIPFMQQKNVGFQEIIDAYESDSHKEIRKKAPIHECVLNAVIRHLPPPNVAQEYRIEKLWEGDLDSPEGQALKKCDPNGPLFFVITKIVVDPQAGEIATGRIFAGTMKKGLEVYLNRANQKGRVQQVFIYNGAKREIVDNVPAGNIIGISGLKASPGETITLKPSEPFRELSHIFDPVVTKAIEAKNPADLPKLIDVLRIVAKEDPSVHIEINEETGEHLISGMGELHLEVIEDRIRSEKGVEVKTSPPIVVYREVATKASPEDAEGKSPNKHNRLYFRVEPLEPNVIEAIKKGDLREGRVRKKDDDTVQKLIELGYDSKTARNVRDIFDGNIFIDETRGIVQINEIIELVMDMFEDVMKAGGLAQEPCMGMKVKLMDAKLHEDAIHRGPSQMYPAVREGIRAAISSAGPVLFEPVQTLRFEGPAEYMGEISKLINNKRGQLLDMQQEGEHVTVLAKMPVAELFGLSNDLRSATGGRGSSSLVDQSFERLPAELQDKIVAQIRSRKGLN